jgi:hypothetical protein
VAAIRHARGHAGLKTIDARQKLGSQPVSLFWKAKQRKALYMGVYGG